MQGDVRFDKMLAQCARNLAFNDYRLVHARSQSIERRATDFTMNTMQFPSLKAPRVQILPVSKQMRSYTPPALPTAHQSVILLNPAVRQLQKQQSASKPPKFDIQQLIKQHKPKNTSEPRFNVITIQNMFKVNSKQQNPNFQNLKKKLNCSAVVVADVKDKQLRTSEWQMED
ncbi:Hypothetical_protein [Hexamita inflata]|uniref:Hypothetical_protein n=1 Tax=Hexamita inflata TaxID=28002 RepID=A0AA86QXM3_9EUKA|nr:Hypothetical protein HINF_LOCUS55534 [Hexamita inflata]